MTLLLDTSAYSAFKRGNHTVLEHLRHVDTILISATVIAELLSGFAVGTQTQENEDELALFLRTPRVQLIDVTYETAIRYAHIYAYLRAAGTPVPTNDLWIAAAAMEHASPVLTLDRHFEKIPQILVHFVA